MGVLGVPPILMAEVSAADGVTVANEVVSEDEIAPVSDALTPAVIATDADSLIAEVSLVVLLRSVVASELLIAPVSDVLSVADIDAVASDDEIAPVSVLVANVTRMLAVSVEPIAEVSVPGALTPLEAVSDEPIAVESAPEIVIVANE